MRWLRSTYLSTTRNLVELPVSICPIWWRVKNEVILAGYGLSFFLNAISLLAISLPVRVRNHEFIIASKKMRYSRRGMRNRPKSTATPFREYRHNLSASLTIRSLREIDLFLVSWPRMIQQISLIFSEGYRKSFNMASAIFAPSTSWTLASLGLDGFGPKPVSWRCSGMTFQPTSWRMIAGITTPSSPFSDFKSFKA